MPILQKTTIVKVNVHPEQVANVIEWDCPECEQHNKEYTYHIKNRKKVECERCGKSFEIISE